MRKCWAATLGDCSDKISGEHIVSAGLFLGDAVEVRGFSWCQDQPKTIGIAALTKNVLCTKHNTALSPVDDAAIKTFAVFRECMRLQSVRQQMKPRRWTVSKEQVDGVPLERWFLKTLITIASGGKNPIGKESTTGGEPSRNLVELVFGIKRFGGRAGLYSVANIGETGTSEDAITIAPIFERDNDNSCVIGGRFMFRGYRFVLYLAEQGLKEEINFIEKDGKTTKHLTVLYHLSKMNFMNGKYLSHVVNFNW